MSLDGLDVGLHGCKPFVHNLQVNFNVLQIRLHRLPPTGSGQTLLGPGIDVLPPCWQAKPPAGRVIFRPAAPVFAQGLPAFCQHGLFGGGAWRKRQYAIEPSQDIP